MRINDEITLTNEKGRLPALADESENRLAMVSDSETRKAQLKSKSQPLMQVVSRAAKRKVTPLAKPQSTQSRLGTEDALRVSAAGTSPEVPDKAA